MASCAAAMGNRNSAALCRLPHAAAIALRICVCQCSEIK
jgi:hypothetical protein